MDEVIRLFGDPVLRRVASEVSEFDGSLQELARRLLAMQAHERAAGVAAVQLGVELKVFAVDERALSCGRRTEVLVNPLIVENDGEVVEEEGCLSFPGIFCDVIRPRRVGIKAYDLDGNPVEREATGMLARAYVHEIDHLEGRLIIDRVDPDTKEWILSKMKAHVEAAVRTGASIQ